jgi:hypothetical protein
MCFDDHSRAIHTHASCRAYVTFGDINEEKGASMEKELAP